MRSLYPLIVFALALTTAATAHAQVVDVVPPATYVAPTPYVAPAPVYASPTTTYYGGTTYPYVTRPYVTRYGYAPSATLAPSYPYQTWLAPRPIYYGAMRPIAPVRTYIW
jgi:hypothetical protein